MASQLPNPSKPQDPVRSLFRKRPGKAERPGDNSEHPVRGSRITKTNNSQKRPKTSRPANRRETIPSELILVHVNNRLGTKSAIRCAATTSVKEFKNLIAHRTGVKAEDILLKRQGQKPFKNSLTLQDYEIGHNSSINLELDTTD